MQIQELKDIGVVTANLAASREFYENHLGFMPVFVSDWYVHLKNGPVELGLMEARAEWPAGPARPVWISVGVADVDAEHARLTAAGVTPEGAPENKPWGERCFVVRDPNGLAVNLSQSIPVDDAFLLEQNQLIHAAG